MPISSPSYFLEQGPQRQIVGATAGFGSLGARDFLAGQNAAQQTGVAMSDLIVIGDNALAGGTTLAPLNLAGLAGSVVVGSQALKALTTQSSGGTGQAPVTVIGFNALPQALDANSSVVVGSSCFTAWAAAAGIPWADNVALGASVGDKLLAGANGCYANVLIGRFACSTPLNGIGLTISRNVIIGDIACGALAQNQGTGGPGLDQNVVIGHAAGSTMLNNSLVAGSTLNVAVGHGADVPGTGSSNVVIGANAQSGAGSAGINYGTVIGTSALIGSGSAASTVLGAFAATGNNSARCIVIGGGANNAVANLGNDALLVETNDGAAPRRVMFYGVMCDGATAGTGLVIGFSTAGVNRDIQGKNSVKLLDGAVGAGAPVGGGYFYGSGGRLHWVDTGGNDWVLTGTAAGQLASSVVAYTNNAGAAAGTLTNAPAAGNPTKWIPINDNGTIRNIPAW